MKKLVIRTAQMYKGKGEKDALDITIKSGDKVFAPSWTIVMGHKDGKIDDAGYTKVYTEMMRESYRDNRDRWIEVVNSGSVTLLCYCKADAFCHRHILAQFLERVAIAQGIEVEMKGEIR